MILGYVPMPFMMRERIISDGASVIFTLAPLRCDFCNDATVVVPVTTERPRVMFVHAVPVQSALTSSCEAVPSSMMNPYVLEASVVPTISVAEVSVIDVALEDIADAKLVSNNATTVGTALVPPSFGK